MAASRGEACGYCMFPFQEDKEDEKTKWLPLQCRVCSKLFHLDCLNCESRPTALCGDQLFDFICSFCSYNGVDSWTRLNLNWVHVIHLSLYNLMISDNKGRNGFYKWNTHICKFIEDHWSDLMPSRYKTSSWQCTVAGVISINCPAIFCSGTQTLGESGWWSLKEMSPPILKDVLKNLSGTERYRRGASFKKQIEDTKVITPLVPDRLRSKKRLLQQEQDTSFSNKKVKEEIEAPPENTNPSSSEPPPSSPSLSKLNPFTPRQENILIDAMSCLPKDKINPATARFIRKLKVRRMKRNRDCPIFNLDKFVQQSLANTEHYTCSNSVELPHPLMSPNATIVEENATSNNDDKATYSLSTISKATAILRRLDNPDIPVLVPQVKSQDKFVSPYTSHFLMPHIFRSDDFCPPKIQILQELMSKRGSIPYHAKPFTFSYFRIAHLPSVNALISYFFWPVDLTEYLQYPDFTVVVMYGDKLCIGCGFMTPDVSVSEAYIPFLLVHPDFRSCNIGHIMLYHLIQSCQGKDVILHVSVNNPAMLLYQKFGFKTEQFCIDFYERYYPPKYHLSKHAFLMRLKR